MWSNLFVQRLSILDRMLEVFQLEAIWCDDFAEVPASSGVYLIWGESHELEYVGTSIALRQRLRNHPCYSHPYHTVTVIETGEEAERFALETALIFLLCPIFNIKGRRVKIPYWLSTYRRSLKKGDWLSKPPHNLIQKKALAL